MKKILILLGALSMITSCAPMIKVYYKDKSEAKGIPFYTQKGIINQETHYLFTYKEVTFVEKTIEEKAKEFRLANKRVDRSEDFATILEKVDLLNGATLAQRQTLKDEIIDLINQMSEKDINNVNSTDVSVIGNFWKFSSYIDYSNPHYINGNMPWFGTASFNQKINDKGTLSEITASADSQIDDLIGTLAGLATPISNVKIAKINADASEDEEDEASIGRVWELRVTEKGFLYTFFRTVCDGSCKEYGKQKNFPPIDFELNGHYKRVNYPISVAKTKEDDKSAIKVSGSIVLPEKK